MHVSNDISSTASDRHAYLVMAHHNFDQLCRLLELLDDERNDIYLHIDKKSRNVPYERIGKALNKAKLYPVKRISITWGGFSMVRCEYLLMEEAIKKPHTYYHLVTGHDLPLKSQEEIHDFFVQHGGQQFINFDSKVNSKKEVLHRHDQYRFLQDIIGRNQGRFYDFLRRLEKYSMKAQKRLGVRRKIGKIRFYKGSAFYSVTEDFVRYVLSQKKEVEHLLNYTLYSDEFFMQTLCMNSEYKDKVSPIRTRYIDWKRKPGDGGPYVFTINDFETLMESDCLFARKFDESKDNEIIMKIHDYVLNQSKKTGTDA